VAKPEWGIKRLCQACGAKFYDFNKSPILCPSCGGTFDPESLLKSRRSRPSAAAKAPAPVVAKVVKPVKDDDDENDLDLDGSNDDVLDDDVGGDDDVIEDTSDLGDDDLTDVVVDDKSEDSN